MPLLLLFFACSASGNGPRVLFDGDGFWDAPFPSDARTVDGHPDLSGLPGREDYDLVELYASDIESLRGFGTNAPIWLRFDGDLDLEALPSPAESTWPGSPLLLVDVDPDSPERGSLVPWTWAWQATPTTFQADQLLAVQPLWGFPLQPARTYALVLRTDIARPSGVFPEVFAADHPEHAAYASLGETLFQLGIDSQEVAAATVFTTQDPVSEMAVYVDHIRSAISTPALDQALSRATTTAYYSAWLGELWVPLWQQGEKPYLTEGGGFLQDADGVPVMGAWERARFTLSLPVGLDMPEGGWPVVIYGHGTGGDYRSLGSSYDVLEVASVLGRHGMAGLCISLPLHGDRGTGADPELLSFNYFNPTAARGNFRQAALDQVYLAELLRSQAHQFELVELDGSPAGAARLDPDRVAYMGHSHGGIVGAMAAPWLGEQLPAVFLSGAGASLSMSIVYRKAEGLDIQELISTTFELAPDEELLTTHPLIGMVQTLGEAVDPLNYAPYWSQRPPPWSASPADVLMTSGLLDEQTPSITAEILAGAGGLPILDPVAEVQPVNELLGLVGQPSPAALNLLAWDGTPVSGGLAQFPDGDHFPIFTDGDAAELYATFLETALSGQDPLIDYEID